MEQCVTPIVPNRSSLRRHASLATRGCEARRTMEAGAGQPRASPPLGWVPTVSGSEPTYFRPRHIRPWETWLRPTDGEGHGRRLRPCHSGAPHPGYSRDLRAPGVPWPHVFHLELGKPVGCLRPLGLAGPGAPGQGPGNRPPMPAGRGSGKKRRPRGNRGDRGPCPAPKGGPLA